MRDTNLHNEFYFFHKKEVLFKLKLLIFYKIIKKLILTKIKDF